MLTRRSDQRGLWEADRLYIDHVGAESFYGLMASLRGQFFRDEDFAELYCPDNGRGSVPPSLLATALLLQAYDQTSDLESKARADFDVRWKVALGIAIEDRPFAKSTLQTFRAQLILHEQAGEIFQRSLQFARESGFLRGRRMRVALDTTNILGRGAVKDTYNLLADGIVQLLRALAAVDGIDLESAAISRGYDRYLASSIKGEVEIDWADREARREFLREIVSDADRLLESARQEQERFGPDSAARGQIVAAAQLLGQLLLQDVERNEDGPALKNGVTRDRVVSVHDPEMRHGHKSRRKRFDGHKASVAVDTDSQLVTAVAVLPGNAPDNMDALELVEQSEAEQPARWKRPSATPPTGTAAPGRPSPMPGAPWSPRYRAVPTRHGSPSRTSRSTLRAEPAPARRGTSLTPCAPQASAPTGWVAPTGLRSSSSTQRSVAPARCAHSVSRRAGARGGR